LYKQAPNGQIIRWEGSPIKFEDLDVTMKKLRAEGTKVVISKDYQNEINKILEYK